jgi:hypothetical protein
VGQADQLLLDAAQAQLEPTAAFPNVSERAFEELEATPPLVPLLYAEKDRVDVHHSPPNGSPRQSIFRWRAEPHLAR